MLREFGLGIALLLLVFLAACINYEDETLLEQYKQRCLDLTSYDSGYIPKCTSHEECLALVEKSLFDFSDSELSLQSKQILYSYKTHLAMVWLYYNEAMKYVKEIRKACSDKDFDKAMSNANDFRYFIEKAFAEHDSLLDASTAFILYEKSNLEDQNIGLMKEEPLYGLYIKLSDNARQIFSEKYLGLDNYSSNLRRISLNVSSMRAFSGAEPKIIAKKTLSELFIGLIPAPFNYYFSNTKQDNIYVPIFSEAIEKYAELALTYSKTDRMLAFLEEERPDEFLGLLSELSGTRSSLASDFASLVKQDALQRIFLSEELASLEKNVEEKIKAADKKAEFFCNSSFAYADENFLANLQALLGKQLAFSFESQTFSSLADASANAKPKISAISKELSELKSAFASGRATIGFRASKLKELNIRISQIVSSLEKLEGSFYALIDACNSEVLSSTQDSELAVLKERYKQAAPNEKLVFCSEFVEISASRKASQLRRSSNDALLKEMDCSKKLSVLIAFVKNDSLVQRYRKLVDSNNVAFECTMLLSSVEQEIRQNYDIEQIEALFNELSEYYYFLEQFANEKSPQFYEIRSYFDARGLMLEKAMPSINTLRWNITKLHAEVLEKASSFLSKHVREHFTITAFPMQDLVLRSDAKTNAEARFMLSFENPFFDFQHQISVEVPFAAKSCTMLSQSPNIASATFGDKAIRLDLNMMLKGISYAEFSCTKSFGLYLISQEVALNSDFGIVAEKYRIESDAMLPSAKLMFLNQHGTASLVFHDREIPLVHDSGYVSARLNDIQPNETISVNYFLQQPLKVELAKISEQKSQDENTATFSYLCTVQNLTKFASKNSYFVVPIFASKSVDVLDEVGKKVSCQQDSRGLRVALDSIDAYGRRAFYLKFTVDDFNAYKAKIVASIDELLSGISQNEELKKEASEIIASIEKNKDSIQKLQELYAKALALKSKDDAQKQLYSQYSFLRYALQNAIEDSNKELENASAKGLYDLAGLIKTRIESASSNLASAEAMFKSDPSKAISLLEQAISSLQSFNTGTGTSIRENVSKLIESANKVAKLLNDLGISDSNSTAMVSGAYALQEQILSHLLKGELSEASRGLDLLEQTVSDLNKYCAQRIDEETKKLAETIDFVIGVSNTYEARIDSLKAQLNNVSKELLIEARYLPAFDGQMLDNIAKSLGASKDALWLDAEQMLKEGKYIDALKFARSKRLSEKASKIREAESRLAGIENSLKSSASYYIELLEKDSANSERTQSILHAARKKFAEQQYLDAIVTAKIGLASLEGKEKNQDIVAYGMLIVFVFAAVLYFAKNFRKKETLRPKRVLKSFGYD